MTELIRQTTNDLGRIDRIESGSSEMKDRLKTIIVIAIFVIVSIFEFSFQVTHQGGLAHSFRRGQECDRILEDT